MTPTLSRPPLSLQPKVKCFGSVAALCAEGLLSAGDQDAVPTINLEVAPRVRESVSWEKKIVLQLSDTELPTLCCVLLGFLPAIHLKRPGKGIEVIRQPNKLFVKATAGAGVNYLLPITIGDTFRLSALCLSQLKLQSGIQDEGAIVAALRGAAALYQADESRRN